MALVLRYIGNYPRNALLFACCAVKFIVLRIYSVLFFGKPLTSRQINCKIIQYVGYHTIFLPKTQMDNLLSFGGIS